MYTIKLLLTNPHKYNNEQLNEIEDLGFEILLWKNESETLSEDLLDSEVVVCNSLFVHNDVSQFTRLKMVQLTSVGFDRVPMQEIKDKGILIENAGDVYSIPMAEWVISKILEIYKEARFFEKAQSANEWRKNRNLLELNGKTVGILGTGNVGIEVAKRVKAFGTTTIGINTSGHIAHSFDFCYKIQDLNSVISDFDILVLALPLTEATKNLLSSTIFSIMKNSAILINVARGGIVNESDLLEALINGELRAAALDVFFEEPLPERSKLWNNPNILISPHNSFVSENIDERLFQLIIKNLRSFVS